MTGTRDPVPGRADVTRLPDPEHDHTVAALVRALEHDAAAIDPADHLLQLRARSRAGARRRPVVAAACAAAVAAATALGVGLLSRQTPGPTTPAASTGATSRATPTSATSASASATTTARTVTARVLPVYYLGRDGDRLALFREFHRRDVTQDAVLAAALQEATDADGPEDPDLSAPWQPRTSALQVSGPRAGVVTVDLPASEGQARGRTPEQARLALQQLVWTATAVEQDAGLGLRVLIDGRPGRLFGAVAVGGVVRRATPAYEVLGSIWIEAPAEGETLRGPVTVRGSACTFEANVAWQLLRGGRVQRSGTTTASSGCPARGSWSVPLGTLGPGTWTLRAYEPPASGQGPEREQTRTFVVR